MIRLNLLGSPQIIWEDEPILLASTKAQALLFYLVLTERTHSRIALAELLWPEKSENEARSNLRQALYLLRRLFPALLVTTRGTVGLQQQAPVQVDVHCYELAVQQGLAGDIEAIHEAAKLYRGDFLSGFHVHGAVTFEEWVRTMHERLHKSAIQVLRQLTTHYVANRDSTHGLPYATQLVQLEPWHEESHYQMMQLLAWDGQSHAALLQYERCCQLLADELGISPSIKMMALVDAIQQGTVKIVARPVHYHQEQPSPVSAGAGILAAHPSRTFGGREALRNRHSAETSNRPTIEGSTPHTLPTPPASFVGRTAAVAQLSQLILPNDLNGQAQQTRLVTLLGPGGVGKTRLALHVANELLPHFPDGIGFIDLAVLFEPELILQSIAGLFAIHEEGDQGLLDTLCIRLAGKVTLLIFDNCEHVIADCAQLIQQLLHALPLLHVVATSRQPLHIHEETPFVVPPLPLPPLPFSAAAQEPLTAILAYDAIRLFVERAGNLVPGFALTHANCTPIMQITQWLDGLPLAIELVAARTRILTVDQIAEQLRIQPATQLDIAARPRVVTVERHQSLRNLIAWSYDLLPEAEQQLLQILAIFAGGAQFTLLQAIVDERSHDLASKSTLNGLLLDLLEELVDKSLIVAEPVGTVMRYRQLESIRQFALEKVVTNGDEDDWRKSHLRTYLGFAEKMAAMQATMPRTEWLAQIAIEMDNVRGALTWSLRSGAIAEGLRIALAIGDYWFTQGFQRELVRWLEELLANDNGVVSKPLRLAALGDLDFIYWWILEDYPRAQEIQASVLELAEGLNDQFVIEKTLNNLAGVALRLGNYEMARQHLARSRALSLAGDHQLNYAWSQILLGEVALATQVEGEAAEAFEAAIGLLRRLDIPNLLAYPLRRMGQLARCQGDYPSALRYYHESLQLNHTAAELQGICATCVSYAELYNTQHKVERAIRLAAVIARTLQQNQLRLPFVERGHFAELMHQLQETVAAATFARSWAEGAAISMATMVAQLLQSHNRANA